MNLVRKDKETENRKKDSVEIQNAEDQSVKLKRNLNEIKSKLSKSEDLHHKLKCEVDGYTR